MVDVDRSQVYAAELAAFDGTDLEHVVGVDVLRGLIERAVAGEWWPGGPVAVRASRADARSSVTRCAVTEVAVAELSFASPQATVATAAHELAHALATVESGHDAVYRRAHVDVVQVMTNLDRVGARGVLHVDQLTAAYRAAGLALGERMWPAPPAVGGAIAL